MKKVDIVSYQCIILEKETTISEVGALADDRPVYAHVKSYVIHNMAIFRIRGLITANVGFISKKILYIIKSVIQFFWT